MTHIIHVLGILILGIAIGILISKYVYSRNENNEGFENEIKCSECGQDSPCDCPNNGHPACPPCKQPNMNKYVLKSTIPPCPVLPDMSNYILKSECPPVSDLSNYVLKSSIPKQSPIILDCSKCNKPSGECPPCPRQRCPEVLCPTPTKCASCAPCPRTKCPPAVVKCKTELSPNNESVVRPYLAPLSYRGFGMD